MHLTINITTASKEKMLQEMHELIQSVSAELDSPICNECTSCKDPKKGCTTGGGTEDPTEDIRSTWTLTRNYKPYKES